MTVDMPDPFERVAREFLGDRSYRKVAPGTRKHRFFERETREVVDEPLPPGRYLFETWELVDVGTLTVNETTLIGHLP